MKTPINGQALLDARRKGLKPRGVVLVTDSKEKLADCQLVILPPFAYDFTALRGLDVFFAMELDYLGKQFTPYARWYESTINDVQKHCKNLFVIPSEKYWSRA